MAQFAEVVGEGILAQLMNGTGSQAFVATSQL